MDFGIGFRSSLFRRPGFEVFSQPYICSELNERNRKGQRTETTSLEYEINNKSTIKAPLEVLWADP